jgi:large subunit ribosomal protein L21
MFAVIETGGKQYRVKENDTIVVEKLPGAPGEQVDLDRVLLVERDGEVIVGKPTVAGAKVRCRLVGQGKGKKLVVFTYKAKDNVRRRLGHRQQLTRLVVEKIEAPPEPEKEAKDGA